MKFIDSYRNYRNYLRTGVIRTNRDKIIRYYDYQVCYTTYKYNNLFHDLQVDFPSLYAVRERLSINVCICHITFTSTILTFLVSAKKSSASRQTTREENQTNITRRIHPNRRDLTLTSRYIIHYMHNICTYVAQVL